MAKRHLILIAAVGYIRMSSDKQEASPEQQKREIIKLAAQLGYRIIRWYTDDAISGDATEKRHAFQKMITDAETCGDFKAVLCWDQDRFGRFDSIEAGRWIHPLRQAGVHLVTVSQGKIDWNDFAGRMMYGIQQEAKHQFLHDLSRNATRGLITKAKRGEWPTGPVPLGYKIDGDHRLILSESEDVELVRWVFREYLTGKSLRALVGELNRQRVGARVWTVSTIRDILTREIYTGDFVWGARPRGKYNTALDMNEQSKVFIPNNHPAIIDRATFDAVQKRLTARKNGCSTPHTGGGEFVLTGLLKCAKCGSPMYGHSCRGKRYYLCGGYQHKSAAFCDRNSVQQDQVLDDVISAIEREYLNPTVIQRLRDSLHRQIRKSTGKHDVGKLRRDLASVGSKLKTAKRNLALVDPENIPDVQSTIREMKAKQQQLQDAIKATQTPRKHLIENADSRVDMMVKTFSRLRETLQKADKGRLREFLREAITKVQLRVESIPGGKRSRFKLVGGSIHMQSLNLFGIPSFPTP